MVWAHIIDNERDVLDVEATCTDRRRYENVSYSQLEVLDRELSICLVHTAVQSK